MGIHERAKFWGVVVRVVCVMTRGEIGVHGGDGWKSKGVSRLIQTNMAMDSNGYGGLWKA